jgi:CDP-diacylglycerol---glycerol-3-phosphate 3-phosphatidyltransferase
MNLPNALTLSRLLLAPVVVLLLTVATDGSLLVAGLFGIAAATDGLDGHLARSRDTVTRFGIIADPLADKLLVLSTLFALVAVDRLAAWVALVILLREAAVSGLRYFAGRRASLIPAGPLGKAKMAAQVGTIMVLIAVPNPEALWVLSLVYSTVLVTAVSGVDYFLSYRRARPATAVPARGLAAQAAGSQRALP